MIIKVIPETLAEKKRVKEIEYTGVKEFFMFGNRKDSDGSFIDFQEWSGSYRYLIGSVHYFTDFLLDEQRNKTSQTAELNIAPSAPKLEIQEIPIPEEVVPEDSKTQAKVEAVEAVSQQLIKKSGAQDGEIDGIIEVASKIQSVPSVPSAPFLRLVNQDETAVDPSDSGKSKKS